MTPSSSSGVSAAPRLPAGSGARELALTRGATMRRTAIACRGVPCRGRARPPRCWWVAGKMAARTPLLLRGADCFRKRLFYFLRNYAEKFCLRAVMAIAEDERIRGAPFSGAGYFVAPPALPFGEQ
jgi:hypothetical protein